MKERNPFLLTEYVSPKYFCNRKTETERIVGAVTNNRSIVLLARKGLGKTSLIHNVFYELKELDNYQTIYLNVSSISNMSDFLDIFVNTLIVSKTVVIVKKENARVILDRIFLNKHVNYLTSKVFYKIRKENEKEVFENLELIFNYLKTQNKKIVIAFDEYQTIFDYPQKLFTQLLIEIINQSENISLIFSSSNQTKLLNMFDHENNSNKNIEKLQVEPLEKKKYKKFIFKMFNKNKVKISDESLEFILEWTRLNTYCVQKICNSLYMKKQKKIKLISVKEVINNILSNNAKYYLTYKKLLSNYQWKMLKAIALEGKAKTITSRFFIKKYRLNAPSSVKTAITALIEKGLITRENNTYVVNDIFFEKWLSD